MFMFIVLFIAVIVGYPRQSEIVLHLGRRVQIDLSRVDVKHRSINLVPKLQLMKDSPLAYLRNPVGTEAC